MTCNLGCSRARVRSPVSGGGGPAGGGVGDPDGDPAAVVQAGGVGGVFRGGDGLVLGNDVVDRRYRVGQG